MTSRESESELLYQRLINEENVDQRLKTSLQRIRIACDELEKETHKQLKNGVQFARSPMTVSAVGCKCQEMFGGPSAASITKNRKKEPLKYEYIRARSLELGIPIHTPPADALSNLGNQSLRTYISMLEERVKAQEGFIAGLSTTMKRIAPVSLDGLMNDAMGETISRSIQASTATESRVAAQRAIAKLLDGDHLRRFGLKLDRDYIIDSVSGDELLTDADVNALRSFLSIFSET